MSHSDNNLNSNYIAYIVLAHSDPDLFGRLIRRIVNSRARIFVHVDKKAQLEPFKKKADGIKGVYFVEPRIRVMWAGFSQVESTINTLDFAIKMTDEYCTHMVIISGADYPLVSSGKIIDFFLKNRNKQFIRRFSVMESEDQHQIWRIKGRHFRELADRFTLRRKPLYIVEQMLHIFPRSIPDRLTVALGSNWVAITRNCARYCVERARKDKDLVNFFKPAFGPDEMFLHTLVQNSDFSKEADPIEPYVDITKPGGPFYYGNVHYLVPDVPIRTKGEAEQIMLSKRDKFFTRKFSSKYSTDALDYIDRVIMTELTDPLY